MKTNQRRSSQNNVITPAQSVENGIKVLRVALKKKISVSAASIQCGRGKNYVSAIKTKLDRHRSTKAISKELHGQFKNLYSQYQELA
jgi:hypothetical protein